MEMTDVAEDLGPPELQGTLWTCNTPQSSVTISQHTVTSLAFGTHHCLFLTKRGQVYSFGKNTFGQLGSGDTTDHSHVPFYVSAIPSEVSSVACGPHHSAALTTDGHVYMWGKNDFGQCGQCEDVLYSPKLVHIQEACGNCQECGTMVYKPVFVTAISCGPTHSLAVTNKHDIFSWGSGSQLGLGSAERTLPQRIEFLRGHEVISIASGETHTLAVTARTPYLDVDDPTVICDACAANGIVCPLGLPCLSPGSPSSTTANFERVTEVKPADFKQGQNSQVHTAGPNPTCQTDVILNHEATATKNDCNLVEDSTNLSVIEPSKAGCNSFEDSGGTVAGAVALDVEPIVNPRDMPPASASETKEKSPPSGQIETGEDVQLRRPYLSDRTRSPSLPGKRTSSILDDPELAMEFLDRQMGHKPRDRQQKFIPLELNGGTSAASTSTTTSTSVVKNVLSRMSSTVSDRLSFIALGPRLSHASHDGSTESFEFLEVDRSSGSQLENVDAGRNSHALSSSEEKESSCTEANKKEPRNMCTEFQVWSWGKGTHGQLGHGDEIDRLQPCLMKHLNEAGVIKVCAGHGHSLALTGRCTVLSWGLNDVGQLGHSPSSKCVFTPKVIHMPRNELVSDIAAGRIHSLFLVDSGGSQASMYGCGQHECADSAQCLCQKQRKIFHITALRKSGLVTSVFAGGCYSGCIVDNKDSDQWRTLYEFAVTERRYIGHLCKVQAKIHQNLVKNGDIVSDIPEYASSLLKNIIGITNKLISMMSLNACELTQLLQSHTFEKLPSIMENSAGWIDVFSDYVKALSNFLAVGGFVPLSRMLAFSRNMLTPVAKETIGDTSSKDSQGILLQIFSLPVKRICEYARLFTRLLATLNPKDLLFQELQSCSNDWTLLADVLSKEMSLAEATKVFWDSVPQRVVDVYRVPTCRVLRDSKTYPLQLLSAGRFAFHHFILFDDKFTHHQFSGFQNYNLHTLWVEADTEAETTFALTTPEETLVFSCPTPSEKTEWVCALNQAIRNVLRDDNIRSGQREKSLLRNFRRGCGDSRLTPPMARHSTYVFTKSLLYKDANYSGSWLRGMLHGHGRLIWPDGRKYTGRFKNNLQHGEGEYVIPGATGDTVYKGIWKTGKLHGLGSARYPNGDTYEGYFKDGMRDGHGVLKEGKYLSSSSIYIGQWCQNKRHGYGVLDNEREGEKYMGMWQDDLRHGNGIMVTLDDIYYEGNFVNNNLSGYGTMMFQDNTVFKGELGPGGTLNGKGTLTLSNGDIIQGTFYGMWSEGIRITGVYQKAVEGDNGTSDMDSMIHTSDNIHLTVPASEKWKDIFDHCRDMLGIQGVSEAQDNKQAWDAVAVAITNEKKMNTKHRSKCCLDGSLDYLERIPQASKKQNVLTLEQFAEMKDYLTKAFDCIHHPLAYLLEALVGVFRLTYCGIGVHPRLLAHAVSEVKSFCSRLYKIVRILFPDLPPEDKPLFLSLDGDADPSEDDFDINGECVTPNTVVQPILLPRLYPSLSTLYALNNEKEDKHYWERLMKWNKQSDLSLMTFLGVDQKFIDLKFRGGIFASDSQLLAWYSSLHYKGRML
ncbi:alsin-like isoform X2 [Ornithodoros turicata]|uniref:alsin-like isoform X2 n=1 Tax=Ornithodoros turicata TaxID=34597 RepID=UPI003138D8FF